jgi:hypothetical protein
VGPLETKPDLTLKHLNGETTMNNAPMINDPEMSKDLTRAALAQIAGGYSVYCTGSWQYTGTGSKRYSSWEHNF